MFTQCPECQTIQALTLAQLRTSRGMLRCSQCLAMFDALERLSETENISPLESQSPKSLPWDKKNTPRNAYWGAGLLISLLCLMGQIVYFEGYALTQNPSFRPALSALCQLINCHLPVYKNLDEFTILDSSFTPLPDQSYAFKVVISNQAVFAQDYPNIKLSLFDYNGKAFAHRTFQPHDYLTEDDVATLMLADATLEISLSIAAPVTKVGGSSFDLTH